MLVVVVMMVQDMVVMVATLYLALSLPPEVVVVDMVMAVVVATQSVMEQLVVLVAEAVEVVHQAALQQVDKEMLVEIPMLTHQEAGVAVVLMQQVLLQVMLMEVLEVLENLQVFLVHL